MDENSPLIFLPHTIKDISIVNNQLFEVKLIKQNYCFNFQNFY